MAASKTFFEQIPIETVERIAKKFPEESAMCCRLCNSENQSKFATEIAIHLPSLSTPHVFLFRKVLVCLDCGFTEFSIPETELPRLEASDSTAT